MIAWRNEEMKELMKEKEMNAGINEKINECMEE